MKIETSVRGHAFALFVIGTSHGFLVRRTIEEGVGFADQVLLAFAVWTAFLAARALRRDVVWEIDRARAAACPGRGRPRSRRRHRALPPRVRGRSAPGEGGR